MTPYIPKRTPDNPKHHQNNIQTIPKQPPCMHAVYVSPDTGDAPKQLYNLQTYQCDIPPNNYQTTLKQLPYHPPSLPPPPVRRS